VNTLRTLNVWHSCLYLFMEWSNLSSYCLDDVYSLSLFSFSFIFSPSHSSISSVKRGVFYGMCIITWPEFYQILDRKF
jgi:hypothetical protein